MAQTTRQRQPASAARGRTAPSRRSSNAARGARRSAGTRSSSAARANGRRRTSGTRRSSGRQDRNAITAAVNGVGHSIGTAAERIKVPALVGTAAAAGLAGGVALGSKVLSGRRRVSNPLGGSRIIRSAAHEVQQAGKQIAKRGFRLGVGDVDMQVTRNRGQSYERQSPLEVLLHGLTARRPKR
jgi:hypothetical protein